MKKLRIRERLGIHPVMMLLVLCFVTVIVSGILSFFNVQSTFNQVSTVTYDFQVTTEAVNSLFSLSGLKYIFTTTVSSFSNYAVLVNLIIILLGIGVMVYSGFLKHIVTLLTKNVKKTTVTFVLVLICILSSIMGDLSYIVFVPLSALLFLYGKRNPYIGIVTSFAALTCGSALSLFMTSIDSSLLTMTLNNAHVLSSSYAISTYGYLYVDIILIIIVSLVITNITEGYISRKVPKYEFPEEEEKKEEDELQVKLRKRGLIFSLVGGGIYTLIFIYNIIPGLPLSGNLLDYSQSVYIDKLFSYNSFFSNGFVFVIAVLFVILGLLYGIGARTIKNNSEFVESLGHSLNGIGKVLVMIFASATFINIFKQSNIGYVIAGGLTSFITSSSFAGLPLLIVLFLGMIIVSIFLPNVLYSWNIVSAVVPTFMELGIAPEFVELVFRLGASVAIGITPVFSYFILYLAYLENYNKSGKPITIGSAIRLQLPYVAVIGLIYLVFIIVWYILGFPLGIGTSVGM